MYIDDVFVHDMLFAVTIRSPVARGKFLGISPPRLPNAYTLVTAAEIPGAYMLDDMSVPILAKDEISYTGQPIALLIGPDITKLEEYAKNCISKLDPEPPVFSPQASPENMSFNEAGIFARREYGTSNTELIFTAASGIISGEYSTGIQEHWYSEAHGAFAHFTGEKLTLHTPSQWLYHVKRSVAGMLKMNDSLIDLKQTQIGIHLDGKLWYPSLIACQAALASYVTQKPVKLMLTREEDFRYSPKRNAANIKIRSALGENGEVTGTEIDIKANLGGYGIFSEEIIDHSCLGSLGMYKLGKINLKAEALKTNIPPQGPLGGFGLSQGFFAVERHVTHIAESLGQDPAEWRKHNVYVKGDSLATGIKLKESIQIKELIEKAATMGDYHRRWASYELLRRRRCLAPWSFTAEALRGIGIAVAYQGSGFLHSGNDKGVYSLELTLEKNNTLKIKTSIPLFGDDDTKVWKTIASDILEIDSGKIEVIPGFPDSGPAALSRNITVLSRLVGKCCETLKKERTKDSFPITVRRTVKPEKIKLWNVEEKTVDFNAFSRLGWAAAVVETEIDPVTFLPIIRGVWLAVDGGKIIYPARAERAVKTGVNHALGWARNETIEYFDGVIPNSTIHNYDIPAPEEMPPVNIEFIDSGASTPKGIGDLPFSCIPSAYVQSISQAMDHHFDKIPLYAKDIWEAGQLKEIETPAEAEEDAAQENPA